MKRLLLLAAALLIVAIAAGGALLLSSDDETTFTEADAELAVREALARCKHELRDAERVECTDVGVGFACRADGRYVAGFDTPDPEQPQLSVVC